MKFCHFASKLCVLCGVLWPAAWALKLKPPSITSSSYVEWSQVYSHYKQSSMNDIFAGKIPAPAQAGLSLMAIDKLVVGGTVASRGQWPWMVKIFADETLNCGGSLISPLWVLTAGHCVFKVKEFVLYIGAQNVSADFEDGRHVVTSTVSRLHPKYNKEIFANDIALIKLPNKVEMSEFINFVRLPRRSELEKDYVGAKTVVSGWGLTKDSNNFYHKNSTGKKINVNQCGMQSSVLNFIKDKEVISNDECSKNYGNIDKSILCIEGQNNQSICGGDDGGPLIYKESDDKWTQIGIVSFGHKESCVGFPQGFTRVTFYLGWISTKTGLKIAN